ncbi:hypothetical protein BS17DRAFT_102239 [Gyrodon lividus]|nr:hypothetical protein BS17DRAFT_102239 [Gyrodon lividus]
MIIVPGSVALTASFCRFSSAALDQRPSNKSRVGPMNGADSTNYVRSCSLLCVVVSQLLLSFPHAAVPVHPFHASRRGKAVTLTALMISIIWLLGLLTRLPCVSLYSGTSLHKTRMWGSQTTCLRLLVHITSCVSG